MLGVHDGFKLFGALGAQLNRRRDPVGRASARLHVLDKGRTLGRMEHGQLPAPDAVVVGGAVLMGGRQIAGLLGVEGVAPCSVQSFFLPTPTVSISMEPTQ
ncbi:MAG: hypothetical protein RL385_3761 [Pseudomonadota bacterium]|jgi:hypothetical protein